MTTSDQDKRIMLAGRSAREIIQANEHNYAAYITAYSVASHGEVAWSPELTWVYSGMKHPYLNAVLTCQLSATQARELVPTLLASFRARRESAVWMVTTSTTPPDVSEILADNGCEHWSREIGMAMDLAQLPQAPPVPNLSIVPIGDQQVDAWLEVYAQCFDLEPVIRDDYARVLPAILTNHPEVGPYYLASLDGQPAGVTCLFITDETAGIYEVATLAQLRRRGIARAMVLAALREARARGCRLAVLQASPSGAPVYEGIGFQRLGTFDAFGIETAPVPVQAKLGQSG
jgi:GNAT superfamily N-acetyltransferase